MIDIIQQRSLPKLLYKKYLYYDTEDIDSAFVSFTFVDNIPTINF